MLFYSHIPETVRDGCITLVLKVSLDMRWKIEGLNWELNIFKNVKPSIKDIDRCVGLQIRAVVNKKDINNI